MERSERTPLWKGKHRGGAEWRRAFSRLVTLQVLTIAWTTTDPALPDMASQGAVYAFACTGLFY